MNAQRRIFLLGVGPLVLPVLLMVVTAARPGLGQMVPALGGPVEELWVGAAAKGWAEGPAYDGVGGVWFTDLVDPFTSPPRGGTSILRFDIASGMTEVMVRDAGGANGLEFDSVGRLLAAEGHRRRLTRRSTDQLNQIEILANNWQRSPFSSPNDLAIADDGGIYFTDLDASATYYLSSAGILHRVSTGISSNNGIVLSPDGDTLYVASSVSANIMAFHVGVDGLLSNRRIFAAAAGFVPDGLTIDRFGNVYAADLALRELPPRPGLPGSRVRVWNPAGKEVFSFAPPHGAINLEFAPPNDSLYISGWNSLVRVPIQFVPEPSSIALVTIGIGVFALVVLRRSRLQKVEPGSPAQGRAY